MRRGVLVPRYEKGPGVQVGRPCGGRRPTGRRGVGGATRGVQVGRPSGGRRSIRVMAESWQAPPTWPTWAERPAAQRLAALPRVALPAAARSPGAGGATRQQQRLVRRRLVGQRGPSCQSGVSLTPPTGFRPEERARDIARAQEVGALPRHALEELEEGARDEGHSSAGTPGTAWTITSRSARSW